MHSRFAEPSRPIPQQAFDGYDQYTHGLIDRRTFVKRLSRLVALGCSMASLTSALLPNYAQANQVSFNDPAIKASYQKFQAPKGHGEGRGYLVVPAQLQSKTGTLLVVHENRGLNPYVKDVARRVAKHGLIAFAPDALHPLGGYPGNDDGRALQRTMAAAKLEEDFIATAGFVQQHAQGNGKLGAVGFCYGGYIVNMLAASLPGQLHAGVTFYGSPPEKSLRGQVKGPQMLQFAALDERVNNAWP